MRDSFGSYGPLSDAEVESIYADAVIALDASALLHAYRLSPSASDAWLYLLSEVSQRLFVPFQAALEYQRNRLGVIADQSDVVKGIRDEALGALKGVEANVRGRANAISRSRVVEMADVENALAQARSAFAELVQASESRAVELSKALRGVDSVHDRVEQATEARVGLPFDDPELTGIYGDGRERYKRKVPPGFADELAKDTDDRRFGDLVIWKELLRYAAAEGRPAVFVTEDLKEDWLRIAQSPGSGPHPLLRDEFRAEVGQPFWIYSVAGFMARAGSFGGSEIDLGAVHEAVVLEESESAASHLGESQHERLVNLVRAVEMASAAEIADSDQGSFHELRDHLAVMLEAELRAGS